MCLLSEEVRATPCILGQGGVIDSTVGARPVRRYVQQKHEVSLILHSVQASQEFLFSYSSTTKRHTTQFKNQQRALAGVAQWIECRPVNQRVVGLIPTRAHAWFVGQVPSRGRMKGNHILMFLSLSFSLPSSLSKHK